MNSLCIIPCGSRKIWDADPSAQGAYPARYAYVATLHRKCQTYATQHDLSWVILSAKHGFLLPDDEVPGNYNVAFGTRHPEVISLDSLKAQAEAKELNRFRRVVVLGGRKFRDVVPHIFTEAERIEYPLSGCTGIGYMLQRLDQAIHNHTEL
ncbi:DUF6884 domain-containing protein [Paenibacillus sp. YYML68]|uniref:DUF6884 domain-containing protein n=1 Tax=Paenibacillus sp. YYML68 TaxID=2909250 RepID=UPI002492D370|nr:DUF6884 domain-containing protein [Paenibacillus sp. YYML68]